MLKLFVYGTLKPGEKNYQLYCTQAVAVQPAIAHGKLYDLPMGYPAAIFPEVYIVRGYLLTFCAPAVLQTFDELEDYNPHQPPSQNLYQRHQLRVYSSNLAPLGKVWTYSMNLQQIERYGGVFVGDGWWTGKK